MYVPASQRRTACDDVRAMAPDVLRHRVLLTYEAEAENVISDEVIARVPVRAGSALDGKTLREANIELETGLYLLAIRRAGRYIYRPRGHVRLEAGDELIATGPDEGRDRLAELAGYRVLEDDDTGEIELVPSDTR